MNILAQFSNPRAVIGGNMPPMEINDEAPSLIDRARSFYAILSAFLKETPVVQSHEEAKLAANYIEQSRATLGELEDARKARVTPLNDEVKAINDEYRGPRDTLQALKEEVERRATAYGRAEEARRAAIAEAARIEREAAEQRAREAEAIEMDAKACADVGELGVNVATAITQADRAFATFQRADRTAARAVREIPVRLSGGMGRAVSMRKVETLNVDDACAAITTMGLSDGIRDAILSAARAYRKLHGSLPAGVSAEQDRKF